MPNWGARVRLKHLMTEDESHDAVQASMTAIADAAKASGHFIGFDFARWYKIPKGDDTFGPVDYANRLLDSLYDVADSRRIWIE